MARPRSFDDYLAEAVSNPLQGWDFGRLHGQGRLVESPLPWDYRAAVAARVRAAHALLDIGTGGGELLAAIPSIPRRAVATESYGPNVSLAARRLRPLGVEVVRTSGAPDNDEQRGKVSGGRLPFGDDSFDLVVDRNEAFVPAEVARVLRPGGAFVSEQSGSGELLEFCRLLDISPTEADGPEWGLSTAKADLRAVGLTVTQSQEAVVTLSVMDVGALVWYLMAVPWVAPGFSVETHRDRLRSIHREMERTGPIRVSRNAFWFEARKA